MNSGDRSEEQLRAAFAARLNAAPEPPDRMLTRTLTFVAAEPQAVTPGWQSAARWWSALAAPARFATAAAIVVVGGTFAFGAVKATHERVAAGESTSASRVTFDRPAQHVTQLAYTGALQITVRDIAASERRVEELLRRAHGSIVWRETTRATPAVVTTRLRVRVQTERLAATLGAIAALGTVNARSVQTTDLAAALAATSRALRVARTTARARRADFLPGSTRRRQLDAEIEQLSAQSAMLERRIATATVDVVLRAQHEPSPLALRLTSIPLARGLLFAAHHANLARHHPWSLDPAPSRALAVGARADQAAAGGYDRADRV